jgi:hypothetical protein
MDRVAARRLGAGLVQHLDGGLERLARCLASSGR